MSKKVKATHSYYVQLLETKGKNDNVRQFTHFYVVGESFKITFMIIATGYIDTEGKTDEASQKYLQRKIEN